MKNATIKNKGVSPEQRIIDLEECLAGFMVCGANMGMYLEPEMVAWCKERLTGKTRTPVQVWREISSVAVSNGLQKVAILICEDASNLGGPMGTEFTTEMWKKTFPSVEAAKEYAEKDANKYIDKNWSRKWTRHSTGLWGWDARAVVYTIETLKVKS